MRPGRSEPAGLHRLRKQATEAEEGPLELSIKKGKENAPGGRKEGERQEPERVERERDPPPPCPRKERGGERHFLRVLSTL